MLKQIGLVLTITTITLLVASSLIPGQNNKLLIQKPINYNLSINSPIYSIVNLDYGGVLVIDELLIKLASIELVPCEDTTPLPLFGLAYAGHSTAEVNSTKVQFDEALDGLEKDSINFPAKLEYERYCKLHQVFGSPVGKDGPVVSLTGEWQKNDGTSQDIVFDSYSGYGELLEVDINSSTSNGLDVSYDFVQAISQLDLTLSNEMIAGSLLKHLIQNSL